MTFHAPAPDPDAEAWVEVAAQDGRLIAAGYCARTRRLRPDRSYHWFVNDLFFEATPADQAAYAAEVKAWWAGHREAAMAVAGPHWYTGFHDPPR